MRPFFLQVVEEPVKASLQPALVEAEPADEWAALKAYQKLKNA
jgi:hypothetical protein